MCLCVYIGVRLPLRNARERCQKAEVEAKVEVEAEPKAETHTPTHTPKHAYPDTDTGVVARREIIYHGHGDALSFRRWSSGERDSTHTDIHPLILLHPLTILSRHLPIPNFSAWLLHTAWWRGAYRWSLTGPVISRDDW